MSALPFIDLAAQRARLGSRIEDALARVLAHGAYVLGPEVAELERQLQAFCGAPHAVACANGTDALQLALMAEGVGPGDAVIVPAFTFVATGEAAPLVGATPVFTDIHPETMTMTPESLEAGIASAKAAGLRPRVVIPVDLFGQPADYPALQAVADQHGLLMIADAAQSFGASLNGQKVGTFGDYTTTSFFPAKPLGCYGDGGAVFTNTPERANLLISLRQHGQGSDRYENVRIGLNSRLDTLQASILLEKLAIFPDEIEARNRVAARYNEALADVAVVPQVIPGGVSVWAQYTLVVEDRARVATTCREAGVPTAVYYPIPLHRQKGYDMYPSAAPSLPVCEKLSEQVISLPMHPYLSEADQDRVIATVRQALKG